MTAADATIGARVVYRRGLAGVVGVINMVPTEGPMLGKVRIAVPRHGNVWFLLTELELAS